MPNKIIIIVLTIFFSACSAPKPPTVDGDDRSNINATAVKENLAMRAELARMEKRLNQLEKLPKMVIAAPGDIKTAETKTIMVHFPHNGTLFRPTALQKAAMIDLLGDARKVQVRGRTDAHKPSEMDELVAYKRARAAKNFLIELGAHPSTVSINYVSAGDYISNNTTINGKALNRRVEIHFK